MSPANPQNDSSSGVSNSVEGFRPTNSPTDNGIPNFDKAEGFGAQFEMPEPQMNETYMEARPSVKSARESYASADFDLHQRLEALNDLARRLKEALVGPEQDELESILKEGSELISSTWRALSGNATQSYQSLRGELTDNPYKAIMTALRIGIAVSQLVQHRQATMLPNEEAPRDAIVH